MNITSTYSLLSAQALGNKAQPRHMSVHCLNLASMRSPYLELSKWARHLLLLDYNLEQSTLRNVPLLKVLPYVDMHRLS